ncbi:MAG: sigma 54-interacting transcriptional regulator [Acidobacteria bacterium]|nr:sigma 54-interacting transcriptional regulator [Acidobacteriota bacterium]
MSAPPRIETLGELKAAIAAGAYRRRPVKDEVRDNLTGRLRRRETLFPGIIGYDDTVVPQLANAILSRHHFILLGLRGQAKTRILRALTTLLDEWLPVVPGSEINDDPLAPLSAYARHLVSEEGDAMPITWLPREARYVEKLATPDVTIADMIGDIDPIKAAKTGLQLGSELAMHFGLLPRANRGIFAINELPDLAGKIQVGLFNILQEGDVQIKGYPVRLPLDVMVVFSANPEDYTARGKIITPLKDRIGAEIRTHYLASRAEAMAITEQEAWIERGTPVQIPPFVREAVEELAFQARQDRRVDKRSGVSQRMPISVLESVVSNAERRALAAGESMVVPRIIDIYAALPSMTGKLELEYEGELKGADQIGRELIRAAVANVFDGHFPDADTRSIVEWFDLGGSLNLGDLEPASAVLSEAHKVQGLVEMARRAGTPADAAAPQVAAAVDFVLEGLYAQKKISRSDGRGFHGTETARRPSTASDRRTPVLTPDDDDEPGHEGGGRKKKRYYN